jgi:hypothetical protein
MNTEHTELMVVGQQGKAGRPSKYSPETVDRLLAGLADGLSYKSACITAGIGVSTLADWREKYPELEVRMEEAREVARLKMLQRIKRASENDWRAAAEWLKLTFPSDYRRVQPAQSADNTTINVTHNTRVLSPERQQELREQRKRILATTRGASALAPTTATESQGQPVSARIQPSGLLVREPVREAEVIEEEQPEPAPQEPHREPEWVTNWKRAADTKTSQDHEEEVSDDGLSPLR